MIFIFGLELFALVHHFNPKPPLLLYHLYSLRVERLYEDSSARGHALHQLVERRTFDLLPFQVSHAVQEIKQHAALLQLLTEQVVQLCHRGVWTIER